MVACFISNVLCKTGQKIMKSKLFVLGLVLFMVAVPMLAGAQVDFSPSTNAPACGSTVTDLYDFLCRIGLLLTQILPILIALGVLYFVWGVITYVIASDEEAKTTGRNRMIYGIIGLVVILGLWAIVRWVTNTFDLDNTISAPLPNVPVSIP